MNKEKLQKILDLHKLWLDSGGSKGKRADLRRADLQTADLHLADLQGAVLQFTNLQFADLQGADLRHADLRRANLTEADLRGADLKGVYFSYDEKPNVPFLLGNALVTEVYKLNYWWRIKAWFELKPNEMEMAELLYG